jgi:hypothetical protein
MRNGLLLTVLAAAPIAACTSILGDFTVSGTSDDAGGVSDGASQDSGGTGDGGDDGTVTDSTSSDTGGGGDTGGGDTGAADTGAKDAGPDVFDAGFDAACDPPNLVCTAGCVDPRSNGANCGACGHDCEGGGCTNGKCGPRLLLMNEFNAHAMVVDNVNVYWTVGGSAGAVKELPLLGAATPVPLLAGVQWATDIALDGQGRVFFTTSDTSASLFSLYGAQVGVANSAAKMLGPQAGVSFGLAADNNHVYYSVRSTYAGADFFLYSYPSGGGTDMVLAQGTSSRVLSVALDTNNVVYQDQVSGRVYSVGKAGGGTPLEIGTGWQNLGPLLTVGGGFAFWSNQGTTTIDGGTYQGGNLVRNLVTTPGSGGQQLVGLIVGLNSLTTDGNDLFFTSGAAVGSMTFGGQMLPVVATNITGQATLVGANAKYVVWYEMNTGSFYKLVR